MPFKINLKDFIVSYFYKLLSALSLSRMLAEFFLKFVDSSMCGKNFQIYGVDIYRKCIESRQFYSFISSPLKALPPSSYHHNLGRGKLLIPLGSIFSEICFPQE